MPIYDYPKNDELTEEQESAFERIKLDYTINKVLAVDASGKFESTSTDKNQLAKLNTLSDNYGNEKIVVTNNNGNIISSSTNSSELSKLAKISSAVYATDKILVSDQNGNIVASNSQLADLPTAKVISFDVKEAVFYAELGLATEQGWSSTSTGTPDLFTDTLANGSTVKAIRFNDNGNKLYTLEIPLIDEDDLPALSSNGGNIVGRSRLDSTNGFSGFFIGFQMHSVDKRYGCTFTMINNTLQISSGDAEFASFIVADVDPTEYFDYELKVPSNLQPAKLFINGKLQATLIPWGENDGGGGSKITITSGSSSGSNRISYHQFFGASIPFESLSKTISDEDLNADIVTLVTPKFNTDITYNVAADITGKALGHTLQFVTRNISGSITLNNLATPAKLLINGRGALTVHIDQEKALSAINTKDNANVYSLDLSSALVEFVQRTEFDNFVTSNNNLLSGKVDAVVGKQLSTEDFTTAFKTKLENTEILTSAEKQKITDNENAIAGKAPAVHTHNQYAASNHTHSNYVQSSEKGTAGGVATLGSNSKITSAQIPKADSSELASGTPNVFIDAAQLKENLTDKLGSASGIPTLNSTGKIPISQIDMATQADITGGTADKLIDASQLKTVDDASVKQTENRPLVFNGVNKLGRNYYNLTSFYAGNTNSNPIDWVLVKTNINFGSNTIVNLHIDSNGMYGLGYTRTGILKIAHYFTSAISGISAFFISGARISDENAIFNILNVDGKYAYAFKPSFFGHMTVSSIANVNNNLGMNASQAAGWTSESKTEAEVQAYITAEPRSYQGTIAQIENNAIATAQEIIDGTEGKVVDAAQLKALKDSLHIWELNF